MRIASPASSGSTAKATPGTLVVRGGPPACLSFYPFSPATGFLVPGDGRLPCGRVRFEIFAFDRLGRDGLALLGHVRDPT